MITAEIIELIRSAEKTTPVKVYVWEKEPTDYPNARVFPTGVNTKIVFGDWNDIGPALENQESSIAHIEIENDRRNSAISLLDIKNINARIEPGAIIREHVQIGDNAVIMMGAIINVGAIVGTGTMIDMGAVLGARAAVGDNCHIGAGAVLAGVLEPVSATPVIVEDNVIVGANAVIIEGCRIGHDAVIAAGAIVISDVPANAVAAGCPARIVKHKDETTESKTTIISALREL